MTNREHQLKSMLNYYEISLDGIRDEKMTKKEKKSFIDSFLTSYDNYVIDDVIKKVRDLGKQRGDSKMDDISDSDFYDQNTPEEESDPFFDSFKSEEDEEKTSFPMDMNQFSNRKIGSNKKDKFFGMNEEIEHFLSWMSTVLYSADHKVIVTTDDKGVMNIKLEKIGKGGKKK
jgi:hypothetical protein